MTLTDLTLPALEPTPEAQNLPVTLDAAKTFLRIDHADEDDLIRGLIDAAALQIEARCGVSLIARPQRLTKMSNGQTVYLNRYPVISIDAVEVDGVAMPIDANLHARPVLVRLEATGAAQVDFTAGFGTDPDHIPTPLRQGVLLLLAHLYEHRGSEGPDYPMGFPMMVDALIQPYRGMRL